MSNPSPSEYSMDQFVALASHIANLPLDARIVPSRLEETTGIDRALLQAVFDRMADSNTLSRHIAYKCPACGRLLKEDIESGAPDAQPFTCSGCNEEVRISADDTEYIYRKGENWPS